MAGKKKRGLGRGLDALLGPGIDGFEASGTDASGQAGDAGGLRELPVERLRPGKYQPRSSFSAESVSELAASIRARGIMQPIVVRSVEPQGYEIIAGERRWRAAQQAGLDRVPVLVRDVDDEAALAMSLIENIQREDLNALDQARALTRLTDEFQFTHQQIAAAIGKSRSAITNLLRLTSLAEPVADMLMRGDLEMGHARALLTLETSAQVGVARKVVKNGLSVRQTEEMVRRYIQPGKPAVRPVVDADTRRLEENLSHKLGQPVQVRHTRKGHGRLIISYGSLDELDGILSRIGYEEN